MDITIHEPMTVEDWLGKDNTLGKDIWEKKYSQFIPSLGRKENFEEWLERVSGGNQEIKELIIKQKFLFGGRILANRGMNKEGRKITYSNCYVLSTDDSLEDIYQTAHDLARTYSYGGGCGVDLSKLRPSGAKVNNAANSTTGPLSFAEIFEKTTEVIGQEGRRGALMLSLSCEHPDIDKFIDAKVNLDKITHANMSIRATNEFMTAVLKKQKFKCSYNLHSGSGDETIEKEVDADELFTKLAKNNWDMGEPGILFWDTIKNYNLLNKNPEFEYAGVNPCAEEPLPAGGSCLLGSINLAAYVSEDGCFNGAELARDVRTVTFAMNEVLFEGLPLHPLEIQRRCVNDWRQIGIGIMGLADALVKMGIVYGSEKAISVSKTTGAVIANAAARASAELVDKYGAYPKMSGVEDIINSNFAQLALSKDTREYIEKCGGMANSQILTIAPTGTLSTMIGCSGGIEPIFANYYTRTTKSLHGEDVEYKVYTPIVKKWMDANPGEDLPKYFITSREIDPINRIKMQGVWQQYIDASISSTINLPESASPQDIKDLYMSAWLNGLKGVTVFRENCRRIAILTTEPPKEESKIEEIDKDEIFSEETLPRGAIMNCSDDLIGLKKKLQTGCGSLHILAYFDPDTGDMCEVYIAKGSTGGCNNTLIGLSRMISLALRGGIDVYSIKDQLDSTGACPSYASRGATKHDTSKGSCCPMAVGNALIEMYEGFQKMIGIDDSIQDLSSQFVKITDKEKEKIKDDTQNSEGERCPECGGKLIHEGGCINCPSCGWSKC